MLSLAVEELLNNRDEKYRCLDPTSDQLVQSHQRRTASVCYIFFKSPEVILMIQS